MAQALRAAALLLLAAGCGHSRQEAASPSQEARGFALTRSLAGKAEWRLESPRATLDEKVSKALLQTPKVTLYKAGRPETDARADKGEVDLNTQDMLLLGSVRVGNAAEKITLRTDELRYLSTAREFRTERPVEIRRPEGVMRGQGLTAAHDLSRIKVHRQETRVE